MLQSECILLVDHDEAHVAFVREFFEKQRISNRVCPVRDGEAAIQFLAGTGPYADRQSFPLPGFALLDASVPSAFEALRWIREHPQFKRLPVVMLTRSNDPACLERAYASGASSCVLKPGDPQSMQQVMAAIQAYWVALVQKPIFSGASDLAGSGDNLRRDA